MPEWPAFTVERWPIDRLKPYPRNAKRHPPEQILALRRSLRQFGWTMPILARADGEVIAGHARLLAARTASIKECPVIVASDWSDEQCRAYGLADNKLTEAGEWDDAMLASELMALCDSVVPIPGFDDAEILKIISDEAPDASPKLDGLGLQFSVVVRCRDEDHQRDLLARFAAEGLTCDALIS